MKIIHSSWVQKKTDHRPNSFESYVFFTPALAHTGVKMILREYYEKLHVNNLKNLDDIDKNII